MDFRLCFFLAVHLFSLTMIHQFYLLCALEVLINFRPATLYLHFLLTIAFSLLQRLQQQLFLSSFSSITFHTAYIPPIFSLTSCYQSCNLIVIISMIAIILTHLQDNHVITTGNCRTPGQTRIQLLLPPVSTAGLVY